MPQTIRTFIAIPIPESVISFLREIQTRLNTSGMRVRWVQVENIHLTLRFLGDINPSEIPSVSKQMDASTQLIRSFSLQAKGVGVFPSISKARVLWVGLTGGLEALQQLHQHLAAGLETVGYPRESRPFRAHLTMGRTKARIDPATLRRSMAPWTTTRSDKFRVDRLVLFQSVLNPTGAVYRTLYTSTLAK